MKTRIVERNGQLFHDTLLGVKQLGPSSASYAHLVGALHADPNTGERTVAISWAPGDREGEVRLLLKTGATIRVPAVTLEEQCLAFAKSKGGRPFAQDFYQFKTPFEHLSAARIEDALNNLIRDGKLVKRGFKLYVKENS